MDKATTVNTVVARPDADMTGNSQVRCIHSMARHSHLERRLEKPASMFSLRSFRGFHLSLKSQKPRRPSMSTGRTSIATRRSIATISADDEDSAPSKLKQQKGKHRHRARSTWRGFSGLRFRPKKAPTTMYSISFYPWKMESHGYYSHPEAAVEWVPDTASSRCQICLAAFNLTHRRHHCRICGHLVCNDCSLQRTYFPFAKDTRSAHHLIKDGAPQRTCNACANTLKNMAAQNDFRVKKFTVQSTHARDGDENTSGQVVEVDQPSQWRQSRVMHADEDDFYNHQLQLARVSSSGQYVFPLSGNRAEELDRILQARALSRERTTTKHYVICSQWLEQWLEYVHVDSPSTMSSRLSCSSGENAFQRSSSTVKKLRQQRHRRPGPISNYSLLNFVNGDLVPKDDLERSRGNEGSGDYRIVSQEVWMVFLSIYGGGPSIQLREEGGSNRVYNNDTIVASLKPVKSQNFLGSVDVYDWIITELEDSLPPIAATHLDRFPEHAARRRQTTTSTPVNDDDRVRIQSDFRSTTSGVMMMTTERCTKHPSLPRQASTPRRRLVYQGNCRRNPSMTSPRPRRAIVAGKSYLHHCLSDSWKEQHSRRGDRVYPASTNDVISEVYTEAVLYDPKEVHSSTNNIPVAKPPVRSQSSNDIVNASNPVEDSTDKSDPRATIAAVSAFASAAAQARKKSAMSLSRHSSFTRMSTISVTNSSHNAMSA